MVGYKCGGAPSGSIPCSGHFTEGGPASKNRHFDVEAEYGAMNPNLIENDWSSHALGLDLTCLCCPQSATCAECGRKETHVDQVVIACAGAGADAGHEAERAAIGVFVGRYSADNRSSTIDVPSATKEVAALRAARHALATAQDFKREGAPMARLIVKSDSADLVQGMTERIAKWKANGWRTPEGHRVKNASQFRRVEAEVVKLEAMDVRVCFWHVPRARNREADELARNALEGKGTVFQNGDVWNRTPVTSC